MSMATTLSKQAQEKIETLLGEKLEPLDFQSLIRVLPRIGEKKGWATREAGRLAWVKGREQVHEIDVMISLTEKFMFASTEPEGMKAVEEYLMKLLKS